MWRATLEQGSDHLSDHRHGPVGSTELDARGRTDRRASLDLTDAADNPTEAACLSTITTRCR
jgi:hypothetical protein